MRLANTDPQVYTSFLEVSQLLKSPLELFHPLVVLRMMNKALQ